MICVGDIVNIVGDKERKFVVKKVSGNSLLAFEWEDGKEKRMGDIFFGWLDGVEMCGVAKKEIKMGNKMFDNKNIIEACKVRAKDNLQWADLYEKYEKDVEGAKYRKFRFVIEGEDIYTDGDFCINETDVGFSYMTDATCNFISRWYEDFNVNQLEFASPYYANKVRFPSRFCIVKDGDYEYSIPRFEVEYLMYEQKEYADDLRPLLEFAQFICWVMIKSIRGKFCVIDEYVQFFSDMINRFKIDNFCMNVIGKRRTFRLFHPVNETFVFGGNADGVINVSLEEVKDE